MKKNNKTKKIKVEDMEIDKPKNTSKTLKRLLLCMSNQRLRLLIVVISVIFYAILTIAAPFYSAHVIDLIWGKIQAAISGGVRFSITWAHGGQEIFFMLLLYIITWLFYTLQTFLMASCAERLNLKLRSQISEKLNNLPLAYFDKHQKGEILSRTINDLDKLSETLQTGLLKFIASAGTIIGSIAMMFYFSTPLALIFVLFTAVSVIVTFVVAGKTLKYAAERQKDMSEVTAQVEEAYSGRTIIKAFNRENESAQKIKDACDRLAASTQKADTIINAVNPSIRFINRIGQVLIAVLGGKLLLDGVISIGRFQAFFQYVNQSAEPITEAAYVINNMQSALASAERVFEILDEEEISPDIQNAKIDRAKGKVTFCSVSFGYSPDYILMKNINFTALPGQKIAIVGSTGAGKTTLINLLMRFYELSGGQILLDDIKTTDMTRHSLRENFGMVLQDSWLFKGSIAENIAYGKPDSSREEIIAAAKAARAHYFIRTMPGGYDTLLDDDAENISAGQRQLLTIARVLLSNPPILILDEATSSVDTRTEIEIGKAMKKLMENRTSFVIAHRLSTIRDADMILVMQSGNIIEQGDHDSLLAQKGAYSQLYYSQFA